MKKLFITISFLVASNAFAQDSEPTDTQESQIPKNDSFLKITEQISGWNAPILYNMRDLRRLDEALQIYDYQIERMRRNQLLASSNAQNDEELDELLRSANLSDKPQDGSNFTEINTSIFPVFYLSSIMYYSPEQWVVWINNKKITQDTIPSTIEVISVEKDKIDLLWRPTNYELIQEELNSRGLGNNPLGENIEIDRENQTISFSLMPNQSFVSKTIEIVEGKAKETEVSLNNNQTINSSDNESVFEILNSASEPKGNKSPQVKGNISPSLNSDEQNMENAIGILKTITKNPIGE